jgi:hypothetical protein
VLLIIMLHAADGKDAYERQKLSITSS